VGEKIRKRYVDTMIGPFFLYFFLSLPPPPPQPPRV